jgi:hypothetical protein
MWGRVETASHFKIWSDTRCQLSGTLRPQVGERPVPATDTCAAPNYNTISLSQEVAQATMHMSFQASTRIAWASIAPLVCLLLSTRGRRRRSSVAPAKQLEKIMAR